MSWINLCFGSTLLKKSPEKSFQKYMIHADQFDPKQINEIINFNLKNGIRMLCLITPSKIKEDLNGNESTNVINFPNNQNTTS